MPILLYGRSYWEEVINFEAMVKHNVITKQDLDLFRFAESPEEAFSFLKKGLTQVYKSHDSRMVPRRG
jgi:predicted Rossmann-fold nucleotide-binding protein